MKITDLNLPKRQQIAELRRSERERVPLPSKISELGHPAAVEFLEDKDRSRYAVTMTGLPKVGVNPRSRYNTPVGIYFYPADYYYDKIKAGAELPFQHNAKYIQIMEIVTPDILVLNDVIEDDFENMTATIINLKSSAQYREQVQQFINQAEYSAKVNTPAGRLWYVMWRVSDFIAGSTLRTNKPQTLDGYRPPPRPAVVWNWLIRNLGYKVVIDNGWGIIHDNELTQGVIIDTKGTYRVAATIENAKSLDLERKKARADLNDPAVSEMEKIQILQKHPRWYEFVHKPTEALQLAAVSQRGMMIQFMKKQNPSKAVQMAAVSNDPDAIMQIVNPAPDVQVLAVRKDPFVIGYITDPDPLTQLAAVKQNPYLISRIDNPHKTVQKYVVSREPRYIEHINNPDPAAQKIAVSREPLSIRWIAKPDPAVQLLAVSKKPSAIRYVFNPDPAAVRLAIELDPEMAKYLASDALARKALSQNT
jgi:hypothetical protein